jgi:ABC-type transport system involved in multi-copper enzyme maturation permease subunit
MTLLPIVARELRVTARRRRTYWTRFSIAAIAMAFSGWSFLFLFSMGAAPFAGKMLFSTLIGLAWVYAVIAGVFKTADALSEEKRDGTLGLLFLTDLKGYDIVLGKILAASVNWFFGLLAIFPILALSLLMGGVAPGEFWRKIAALANLLFYSLTLGMFVSSFMRSERRAAGLTVALLIVALFVPSRLSEWHQKRTGALSPAPWLLLPDVSRPLHFADDSLYGRNTNLYWQSLGVSHGIGWALLLLASVIVPHTWQQQAGKLSRLQESAEQISFGINPARRKRFRERALAINPFFWVASRARGRSHAVLLLLGAITAYFTFDYLYAPNTWNSSWSFLWPAFWLQSVLKIWIPFEACRRFVEDRRSGALELILSTPLTPQEIIHGQWRALRRQFGAAIVCVLGADIILAGIGFLVSTGSTTIGNLREQYLFLAMLGASAIVFLADIFALGWLAMWRGMKARHSYTAVLWTLAQILVGPWMLFYVGMSAFMMAVYLPRVIKGNMTAATTQRWDQWIPIIFTGLWFVISMAVAILSAWWARRCLLRYFRYQATASYQPARPLFPKLAKPGTLPPRLT